MSEPPVAIIDGGGANITSLRLALARLWHEALLTTDHDAIRAARHVILPGVGAAAAAMEKLGASGLDRLIPTLTQPVLGICLGMQLLGEGSEEGDVACLGVMPGRARRFTPAPGRPVPHMGWNQLQATPGVALFAGLPAAPWCYFVHSYALPVTPATIATCDYGGAFAAAARAGNFLAVQFHPERSASAGAAILANFLSRY